MRYDREHASLEQAAALLNQIQNDLERLDLVLELQQLLVVCITRCELRITRFQRARQRVPRILAGNRYKPRDDQLKARSRAIKKLRDGIDSRIEDIRHLSFLWRCFGDGIASAYQSSHNLRHLFYDDQYRIKQSAGALVGKEGFELEYATLKRGIEMGVPVVLSDLTNIIRHGDICALAGPDPVPLELKSSRLTGSRVKRQAEKLTQITDFYATDMATDFRGMKRVIRSELLFEEVNYRVAINQCMEDARQSGLAIISPEAGLHYLTFLSSPNDIAGRVDAMVGSVLTSSTLVNLLTPAPSWLPGYPFTLSLSAVNAVAFMQEQIGIIVMMDLAVIKKEFENYGIHCVWIMDGSTALQICIDPADLMRGTFRISEDLFLRVSTEFLSPAGFAREHARAFDSIQGLVQEGIPLGDLDASELVSEPPSDWINVRDCYEADSQG